MLLSKCGQKAIRLITVLRLSKIFWLECIRNERERTAGSLHAGGTPPSDEGIVLIEDINVNMNFRPGKGIRAGSVISPTDRTPP